MTKALRSFKQSPPNPATFSCVPAAPPDPILGLKQFFLEDPHPNKIDLSVGVYQNEDGRTLNLKSVTAAQPRLSDFLQESAYLPIDGLPAFIRPLQQLLFGADSPALKAERIVTVQTLGGTGALRCGADFLKRHFPHAVLYLSDPSWDNHQAIFSRAGFSVATYPYYDPNTRGLNFAALMTALQHMPEQSVVLLHAGCHNPTGIDLSWEQWDLIIDQLAKRRLIPFLDFAYQGFKEGLEDDAWVLRRMAADGMCFLAASSCSKNFALYRRRVGALSIAAANAAQARTLLSQLKTDIRVNHSNPPVDGAALVAIVLQDPALRQSWEQEVQEMRERINAMRRLLLEKLERLGAAEPFAPLKDQYGMFSYSGLNPIQVKRLRDEFSIYIVNSGRLSVSSINQRNVDYLAAALAAVL